MKVDKDELMDAVLFACFVSSIIVILLFDVYLACYFAVSFPILLIPLLFVNAIVMSVFQKAEDIFEL